MHKPMLVPLTVMFLLASALVLTQLAELRFQPAIAASSPKALSTVRAYYSAVDHFLETGDLSQVRTIVVPSLLGDPETGSSQGSLELALKGLRQTYPVLTFDIASMRAADDVVIAEIEVESGPHASLELIEPLYNLHSWRMTETFKVDGNQIVGRWTSGPGLATYFANPVSPVEMSLPRDSRPVTARLTFSAGSSGYLSIPAPAVLIPERGQIQVKGNGVASIFREHGAGGEVTTPDIDTIASRGDVIVVDAARVVLSKGSSQGPATLLAILFVSSEPVTYSREERANPDWLAKALEHPLGDEIGDGISVEPLQHLTDGIEAGPVSIVSGWVVLTAGGAVAIHDGAMPAMVVPVAGKPVVELQQMTKSLSVRNLESRQAVVWVVLIE